jgi:hypothetical protein
MIPLCNADVSHFIESKHLRGIDYTYIIEEEAEYVWTNLKHVGRNGPDLCSRGIPTLPEGKEGDHDKPLSQ